MKPLYYNPSDPAADNSVAINAALADPTFSGVVLPALDLVLDHAIIIPSGKFLVGAGIGATRLIRTDNISSSDYFDKALIRSAQSATGIRVSDLTLVSPKVGDKVQGVWMYGAKDFCVERVATYNCGYAFWAHEYAERGVFRDIQSFNANVHFETTQAYGILFENTVSGDGDGDNPLGVEAVWHCLLASRDITFRHGRHTGGGIAFLIIANDTNSDPKGGLIDNIRFEDCQSVNTDGKLGMQIANFNNLPVGRVALVDSGVEYADRTKAGVPAIISVGQVTMRGGRWKSFSQENFIVYAAARLDSIDVDVIVDSNPAATGSVYNPQGGLVRVFGGTVTITSLIVNIGAGDTLYISPTTVIVTANEVYAPIGIGQTVAYVYKAPVPLASGYNVVGTGTTLPQARFTTVAGREYRVTMAGKMRKDGGSAKLAFYILPASGSIFASGYGPIQMQNAAGIYVTTSDTILLDANAGDVREFNMDFTFISTGSQLSIGFGGGAGGATILAGARLSVERIA
ncbi:hypothetical protein [Sphingomonas sp. Leaf28]|uniref:hypothetical protein n=1 Tax=Sphingomonas sp. Leaf28 TaxID=1735695 RepID=UPI000A47D91C|nr:hypothetical protein [Sphingomonas sp. Leaf28]